MVWWEGMYLGPHHFQAQSRYFEDAIRFGTSLVWGQAYGLSTYRLDSEALGNGTINLLQASGVMPDGLAFNMSAGDAFPPPRNFAQLFPPTDYTLTIHLAIPARRPDGLNCAVKPEDVDERVRYIGQPTILIDETNGRDEKSVDLGRKNFRLILDSEVDNETISLPVARIMRSGSGDFVADPNFIPPCLQIGASPYLMYVTGRLIDIMEEKSASLAPSSSAGSRFSFSSRDIASFWFLHTVNTSLAALRHHYFSKRGHPEELFLEMLRLAGGLCTFALDAHPRTLPVYDHMHPDVCFGLLEKQIRDHLELVIPTNCIQIEMLPTADYFFAGAITDERCIGRSTWLLGVRSGIGEVDLITRVPQLVKICSEKFVGELVRRAMPGLTMTHVPSPPAAVSARPETQYFLINRSGPFWDHIVQTRHVGIYIPGDIPNAEIDLLTILES